jgi:hypothetical protein
MAYKGKAADDVVQQIIDRAIAAIIANNEQSALDFLQEVEANAVEWPWAFYGWEHNKIKLVQLKQALEGSTLTNSQVHAVILTLESNFASTCEMFAKLGNANVHPYAAYINVLALACTVQFEAAREAAIPLMEAAEPGSFIFEHAATVYDMACEGRDPALALALLDRFPDKVDRSAVLNIFAGVRHIENGNVADANEAFSDAAKGARALPITIRGVKTIAPLHGPDVIQYFNFEKWYSDHSNFSFAGEMNAGDGDFVIVCSCNDDYFRQFSQLWIEAVSVSNPSAIVHVNLIKPSEETLRQLPILRERFGGIHLNFSIETTTFMERAYFACSRFFVAPLLMKAYDRKLIITDIDIIVGGNGKELSAALDKSSFGVKVMSGWRLPWQKYVADFVCIANDDVGRRYIEILNCFLGKSFAEKGEDIWWVDQVALFLVVKLLSPAPGYEIFNPEHVTSDLIHLGGITFGTKLGWLIGRVDRMQMCLADLKERHGVA